MLQKAIVLLCFIISIQAFTNNKRRAFIDSLKQELSMSVNAQSKADVAIEIAKNYRQLSLDTALYYANQSIHFVQENKESYAFMYSHMVKGLILKQMAKFNDAIEAFNISLQQAELTNNTKIEAYNYNNLGLVYKNLNKRVEAKSYFAKALELKLKLGDRKKLSTTYDNIAEMDRQIGKMESSLEGYLKALDLRKEFNDSSGIANSYINIGSFYKEQDDAQEALSYFQKALELNIRLNRKLSIVKSYRAIANTYRLMGIEKKSKALKLKALAMNKLALGYALEMKNMRLVASLHNGLGEIYVHLDSFDLAESYLAKGLELSNKYGVTATLFESNLGLGKYYVKRKLADQAIKHLYRSIPLAKLMGDLSELRNAYEYLSDAYMLNNNYQKAYLYHNLFFALHDSLNNVRNASVLAEKRALFDYEQQQKDISNLEKQKELIEEQSALERYLLILFLIAAAIVIFLVTRASRIRKKGFEIVKRQKREVERQRDKVKQKSEELQMSYHTIENLSLIGKEIISNLKIEDVQSTVYKYLRELMEVDVFGIDLYDSGRDCLVTKGMMEFDKVLEDHEAKVSDHYLAGYCFLNATEIHINNFEKEYKNYIDSDYTSVGSDMQSIVYIPLIHANEKLGVLTVQHSHSNAFNGNHLNIIRNIANYSAIAIDNANKYQVLNQQKELIVAQSMEVEESIRYAKNIQNSLLPSNEYMSELLKEHFVYYQPCQIVSGDFYWAHSLKDGKKIIIAADCTGHGVPGAMLSMIAISQLNEIVLNNGVKDPGRILDELRSMMIASMKTNQKQRDDSLDCTAILLDEDNLQIHVAGAFNKLIHVKGKEEIVDYECNRQPVGNYPIMEPFTTRLVEYNKNDVIYLMSDGYYDQIGGPKSKRFGSKRMKDLLREMYDKSMIDQHKHLLAVMKDWEKDMFALDDRCIIGIRL